MNTEEADDAYRHLAELKQEAAMILKLLADERKRGGDGDTAARRRLADVTSTMKALEDEIHNFEAGMVSDDDTEANRDFAGQLVADDKVRTPEPKSAWPVYIQERFGSPINSEVERVLAATVEAANAGRGKLQNNLVTVNTRAFLFPLTENDGPFTLLRLRQSAGEDAGRPPWHESQEMNEEQTHALREAFGKTRPSQEFLGVLEEASSLALKYRFQDQGCMTEWHLAFALLVRRPTGFKWQIQWHGYQIAEVAGILKAKMFSTVPYLANALDWALTELAVENRSIEQSEAKSDLQNQRNKKSRDDAYNLLRNPKGFEWSSSCKNAIETLLNFHQEAHSANPMANATPAPAITSRAFLLASLLYGAQKSESRQKSRGGLLGAMFALSGFAIDDILKMLLDEISGNRGRNSERQDGIISISLQEALRRANEIRESTGNDAYVGSRHIIAALLEDLVKRPRDSKVAPRALEDKIPIFIKELENHINSNVGLQRQDDTTKWKPILEQLKAHLAESTKWKSGGNHSEYSRDSKPDELAGGTLHYARAIASTFLSSGPGDFCFALFGPWGRGKTTLIREVSKKLEPDFTTVTFNAWKFPSRPEVWVWLYETIKQHACGNSELNRLRLAVQTKLREDGGLPLILPGLLLLLASIPKGEFLKWMIPLDGVAAILAILMLLFYVKRVWLGFGGTLAEYMKLPNHARHLGLQATVGSDLKRLLSTWTGSPLEASEGGTKQRKREPLSAEAWPCFRQLLVAHWGFSVAFFLCWCSLSIITYRLYPHATILFRTVVILFDLSTVIAYFVILWPVKRAKSVLLVVDDLDRCPPNEMLSVIESLRVFLDDPEINQMLKIAMLLDRDILSHAIESKYRELLVEDTEAAKGNPQSSRRKGPVKAPRFTNESIVNEQLEKFFLLTFDLPPLDSKEVSDYAEKIAGSASTTTPNSPDDADSPPAHGAGQVSSQESSESTQSTELSGNKIPNVPTKARVWDGDKKQNFGTQDSKPALTQPPPVEEVQLTEQERSELVAVLQSLVKDPKSRTTPRRMRMTKLQYFLAREILRQLGEDFQAKDLLRYFRSGNAVSNPAPRLVEVVHMVTGRAPKQ